MAEHVHVAEQRAASEESALLPTAAATKKQRVGSTSKVMPPPGTFDVCILGSGVSTGVPMMNHVFAGECPKAETRRKSDGKSVCLEAYENPRSKNARGNVSILVRYTPDGSDKTATIMVDAGKTMRPACLKSFPIIGAQSIDALLLTHDHADAVFGLDDLRDLQKQEEVLEEGTGKLIGYRVLGTGGALRILSNKQTLRTARRAFPYLAAPADFVSPGILRRRIACFSWEEIPSDDAALNVGGLGVRCFPVLHGGTYVALGFSFGAAEDGRRPFVYISDVKAVPTSTLEWLQQAPIDILCVDLLRRDDHTTHFSFDEAVAFVRQIQPAKALFVGMASCEVGDHDDVNAELAQIGAADGLDMQLAYDGLLLPPMATMPADPVAFCDTCGPCEGY